MYVFFLILQEIPFIKESLVNIKTEINSKICTLERHFEDKHIEQDMNLDKATKIFSRIPEIEETIKALEVKHETLKSSTKHNFDITFDEFPKIQESLKGIFQKINFSIEQVKLQKEIDEILDENNRYHQRIRQGFSQVELKIVDGVKIATDVRDQFQTLK